MEWKQHSTSRPRRTGLMVAGVAVAVSLLGGSALLAEKEARRERMNTTREALRKWVDTRKTISKTKHNLDEAVELLNERIDMVSSQIESIKERTKESRGVIAEQEKKKSRFEATLEKLSSAADSLDGTVDTLENRTAALLERVPRHVREDTMIATLSRSFTEDPNAAKDPDSGKKKLSLSQRFQNVVGVLNKLNKLSREIKVLPNRVKLADGREAEVKTVFLGFGQAYYIGGNGKIAGVGRLGDDGKWTWSAANDAAEQIARVMAILQDEKPAAFVQVPVEIK